MDQKRFGQRGGVIRSCTVYCVQYITPPWGGFPSSIARQPRGCQYRTIRLWKALSEMFPTPTDYSCCGDMDDGKVGPGVCDIHRRMR